MRNYLFSASILLILAANSPAQDWRSLKPLTSNCDDVKRILDVKTCSFPVSSYEFPKVRINITFKVDPNNRNSVKAPISRILISFTELVKLTGFESNLSEFRVGPDGDIGDGKIYKNDAAGFSFTTQKLSKGGEEFVTSADLYVRRVHKRKH